MDATKTKEMLEKLVKELSDLKPEIKKIKDSDELKGIIIQSINLGVKFLELLFKNSPQKIKQISDLKALLPIIQDERDISKLKIFCLNSIQMVERLAKKIERAEKNFV